ncbi:DUF2339 domain-containing protein [Bryobacter aggregatus]|uniref:DUF2339 domain-containing protein n=1 Tax=Bryobacter aggregatus TaxID=360054 RepID=UPI0004E1C8B3|nr:DUF2339 domain-containing protein [Bryobacter aggregatus]
MEFVVAVLVIAMIAWAIRISLRPDAQLSPDRIALLEQQVAQLTQRIWNLERHNGMQAPPIPQAVPLPIPPTYEEAPPTPIAAVEFTPNLHYEEPPPDFSWESRLGENWLLKLGALILIIGLALLPTYSFGLLGPLGRLLLAVSISLIFLTGGIVVEKCWQHFKHWALGLIAIGWAGLYFTAFASHGIEATHVIDNPIYGLAVLLAVATAMVAHSLVYRDERVTGATFFLAYIAFLIHRDLPIVLPAMTILAVAALIVSWRFAWRWLVLGDLLVTYAAYLLIPGHPHLINNFGDPTLWLLWIVFEAYDLFTQARERGIPVLPQLNAIGFVSASLLVGDQSETHYGYVLTWATLAFAASAFARWRMGLGSKAQNEIDEVTGSGPIASLLITNLTLTAAIFFRFKELGQAFGILLQAQFLFWLGTRQSKKIFTYYSYLLDATFILALLALSYEGRGDSVPHWGPIKLWVLLGVFATLVYTAGGIWTRHKLDGFCRIVAALLVTLIYLHDPVPQLWHALIFALPCALIARYYPAHPSLPIAPRLTLALPILLYLAFTSDHDTPIGLVLTLLYFGMARLETDLPLFRQLYLTVAAAIPFYLLYYQAPAQWLALSLLAYAAALLAIQPLGMAAQGLVALWLACVAYLAGDLNNSARLRTGIPLIAIHALLGARSHFAPRMTKASQFATPIFTALLIGKQLEREWISIGWGLAGASMLGIGFSLQQRWLRFSGLALFGLGILKLFLYDLSGLTGLARILSFLILGLLLIAASWIYTRFKDRLEKLI